MVSQITIDELKTMFQGAIDIIREKRDELCLLDAAIGDGDHGITMLRAMEKMGEVMISQTSGDVSTLLNDIGWALMNIDGGATGPLYGSIFIGMSDATVGKDILDRDSFARMFEGGLKAIEQQTKARAGDKTLLDALIPAVQAIRAAAQQGETIHGMLVAAATAARQGAESTSLIPARYGRAKFQGDRTIGHMDPGSVSVAYVFQGFLAGLGDR
jgi:dihydroxyacetone kinase-like protein